MHYAAAARMALMMSRPANGRPIISLIDADSAPAGALDLTNAASPEALLAALRANPAATGAPAIRTPAGVFAVRPTAGGTDGSRLRGCVALVTGSAQGFGKGIAEGLVRQGACVVIADLNAALGEAFAAELNKATGRHAAIFQSVDVTKSASLDACVRATVLTFGGIDMLVANAGVLKAGGIEEMDESAFDFVTSVNYKAFFLCTKAVTPAMKRQSALNPDCTMDIIQINSKSGLEGSNRNFAYAGSKFGSIGLTQSFAMELVPNNIKVNAICPGNYFEGPLWSDPEKGLFVQYLRAGKVPGAKTIADVKNSYLSKIPMKRGCTPEDVVTAILYLHDQRYETGQAIPVTGGQVMLN
jgi:NAD(P)-dependent dehydrogenase (short-subunit alcohol dehydrogenase family)